MVFGCFLLKKKWGVLGVSRGCQRKLAVNKQLGDDLPQVMLPNIEILQPGFEMVQCVSFFASTSL